MTIDITILNKYNKTGVAQFHKSLLLDLNTQMKINPLIVGDFHILLSTKNRSSRQKKKHNHRNNRINWHPTSNELNRYLQNILSQTKEYTFYSAANRIFSKIEHILRHKAKLYKFKMIEITPYILSDRNAKRKIKINTKIKTSRNMQTCGG